MKISIQIKIVLIYLCTIIIIMLVSGTYIIYNTEESDYKSIQSNMEGMAEHIETRRNWNLDDIRAQIDDLYEVYILDPNGKIESMTVGNMKVGDIVKEEVVIRAIASRSSTTSPIIHFSILMKDKYMDHARVVYDNGDISRIIYVRVNTIDVYNKILNIISTIAIGLIIAMVITGFCGIVFAQMITSPIKALTKNSKRLAKGTSIATIPVESADEIGELTQSFNYMANQLMTTMEVVNSEKNKLEKIFEHMADGVMAFNKQGTLIHMNSICYDMLGNRAYMPNFECVFDGIGLNVGFDEIVSSRAADNDENTIILGDKYLKIHFDSYQNSKLEVDGVVVVIQDVTKQQKLDSMRKEFVANVSHELRTPLTTVKSYTETLIDGAVDDKDMALYFLKVMDKEADRMTALVQDLLELSRIDNKQIQLNLDVVNMRILLDDVLEAQYIHIIKQDHKLEVDYDTNEEYLVFGDIPRIRQVLHNILSNAIKYSPEPGVIKVKLYTEGETIKIEVSDTGMGIPKEDLDRIFERFYRVDKARSRKLGGTGLGLSIAKELMVLQGGDIIITSENGKGTTVILVFPSCNKEAVSCNDIVM